MQQQTFSFRALALSVTAAELGRAILWEGRGGSVRAMLGGEFLASAILVLLSALAGTNSARMARKNFVARCVCAVFLLWYLAELVVAAVMIQQLCWEQFSSMAFLGLLPVFLWAGWMFECGMFERMSGVLWWLLLEGGVLCVLGLAGQLRWQNLIPGGQERFGFPDVWLYPEYFSFPLLCGSGNKPRKDQKPFLFLPLLPALISSGYTLGLAMLFGVDASSRPGYELLRAWNFGGVSRFDAAFLLLWLAAALFRFCFLFRAVRFLCEKLMERPRPAGAEVSG